MSASVHPLDACHAKVRQADAHADALYRETRAFAERKAHRIGQKPDPNTGDYIFYVEVFEAPPLIEWGVRIGDVLHNLRSALDHLTWQLAIFHLGREPAGRDAKNVYCPIALTRADFDRLPVLQVVDPAHVEILRALQPYHRGDRKRAEGHPLVLLRKLSNIDKHRVVHTSYVALRDFRFTARPVRDCEITRITRSLTNVPLVQGQELARVEGVTTGPDPEMEGEAKLSGHLAFSDGTSVQHKLDEMGRSVQHFIEQFRTAL